MATEAEYWRARAILELLIARHPFTTGDPDEVRRWIREVIADMKTGDFNEYLYTIAYEGIYEEMEEGKVGREDGSR